MTDELVKRCGACFHGKAIPKDLTKRVCKGGPPTPVVLPSPQPPGWMIQIVYPNVNAVDEACGAWKSKLMLVDNSEAPAYVPPTRPIVTTS